MPTQKINSKAIDQAEARISTTQGIDIDIDFGNGLSIRSLTEEIQVLRSDINTYNANYTALDLNYKSIREREQKIADWCVRLLDGVACRFGRKSNEYKAVKNIRLYTRSRSTPTTSAKENPVTPEPEKKTEDLKAS